MNEEKDCASLGGGGGLGGLMRGGGALDEGMNGGSCVPSWYRTLIEYDITVVVLVMTRPWCVFMWH